VLSSSAAQMELWRLRRDSSNAEKLSSTILVEIREDSFASVFQLHCVENKNMLFVAFWVLMVGQDAFSFFFDFFFFFLGVVSSTGSVSIGGGATTDAFATAGISSGLYSDNFIANDSSTGLIFA